MARTFAVLLALLMAGVLATSADERPGVRAAALQDAWRHRIVSGYVPVDRKYGFDLVARMNALGAQGFRLATVVQPRPPLLAEELTVILARPGAEQTPAVVQFDVLAASTAAALQGQAAAKRADGFLVRAVTVVQAQWVPTTRAGDAMTFLDSSKHNVHYVAILERAPGATDVETRILETWTRRGGWTPLTEAQREGFRVTESVWLAPRADLNTPEHVLFLLQRRDPVAPHEWSIPTTSPTSLIANVIEKEAKDGYRVESMWSTTDRVEVLLTRPLGGPRSPAPVHDVARETRDQAANLFGEGRLVGAAYRDEGSKNTRYFVQDRVRAGYRYSFVSGVFPRSKDDTGQLGGVDFAGFTVPEVESRCAACVALDARGAEGYRAVWATVGPGYRYRLRMEVLLERAPR